jgi:pimeloyl-ACP methyl ester carboxylesterase
VTVTNPKLLTQLGPNANLNHARYTRFQLDDAATPPDAILILIPGFVGGASDFRILAQILLQRAKADHNLRVEVWAVDRRTNQLEDTEDSSWRSGTDPVLGSIDFGDEPVGCLTCARRAAPCSTTPRRRALLANWTNLVFSRDIDADANGPSRRRATYVFLGGHSAGTGFTARYASTDFNIRPACDGVPQPGYEKLRGLVLEGGGAPPPARVRSPTTRLIITTPLLDGGLSAPVRARRVAPWTARRPYAGHGGDRLRRTKPRSVRRR